MSADRKIQAVFDFFRGGKASNPIQDLPARRRRGTDRLDENATSGMLRMAGTSAFLESLSSLLSPGRTQYGLLDVMRDTIPLLDSGIIALRQITGLPRIVTDDPGLDDLIREEFLEPVSVNDVGIGYDTYLDQNRDNALHYGFSVSELVPGAGFQGVERLKVTDPHSFFWRREEGRPVLFQRGSQPGLDEIRVDDFSAWISYWAYELRRGQPMGYSVLWKLEYPVEIALRILHAADMNWERMGNPSLWLLLKAVFDEKALEASDDPENTPLKKQQRRLNAMMGELTRSMAARKEGRVRDFAAVVAKDEEVSINVLGEPSKLMQPGDYWDILIDQMVSKLGVPPWLLGIHRGTTERLSTNELQMVNSKVASRRRDEEPLIRKDVEQAFALLGRPGTRFKIEWDGINLDDVVESARARLMNAQAEAIEVQNEARRAGNVPAPGPSESQPEGERLPEEGVGVGAGANGDGNVNGNRLAALRRG